MKTASGYYTIHWDCPECGIHNEDLERDLNKSEDRLIGFCEYCCSNSIIDVENVPKHPSIILALSKDTPSHISRKIFELMAYDTEMCESIERDIIDIPFIPVIKHEIPKIQAFTYRYENWDLEGMLHMKDIHDESAKRIGKTVHSVPALCRRMEKRSYSGNCNRILETVI